MYHVTLGGQGLVLDLQTYGRTLAEAFAGKVASGDRTYGDLAHEQVVAVADWSGGEGFLRHDPELSGRHRLAPGMDGLSELGAVRPGPYAVSVYGAGTGDARPARCYAALGKLFVGGDGGKVYHWDGATFSLAFTLSGGNAASFAEFQGKLYIGKSAGGGGIARWDGATLTDPFLTVPAPVSAVYSMGVFYRGSLGYLYLAGDAPDGVRIYYTDGVSLSGLRYQLNEPAIRAEPQVIGQKVTFFGVHLSSARRTGVYSLSDSGGLEKWAYETSLPGRALTTGAVVGEVSYLGSDAGGEIYRWDGNTLDRVTASLAQPYPVALMASASAFGALWLGVSSGSGGDAGTGLKRYDGLGWSEPAAIDGGAPGEIGGLALYNGDLYASRHAGGASQWRLARYRMDAFAASGTVETGLIDGRLPSITKAWRSITVLHSALVSGQSAQVQYRLEDSGAWQALGTSATVGATTATFTFPSPTTARLIAVRVVLSESAGTSAPVKLYGLQVRYVLAAEARREWRFECLLEGTAQVPMVLLDGSNASQTGTQVSAALWNLAAQTGPLTFVDLDGASRPVWLLGYREAVARQSQRLGTQLRGQIRLLEA